jgi:anhydro-N-acetylmuramic acid kinase
LLGHVHQAFDSVLRQSLLALNLSGPDELHRGALAGNALARAYARTVDELLSQCGLTKKDIDALGAHGQTVRHRPGEFDATGYTVQLLNGALLAELSGMDVICDFRSRDVAAGGQGAPLVPAFHQAMFGQPGQSSAVLNIGGMANLTLLAGDGRVLGFDCGPGNVLMDLWCERHLGQAYDQDGRWAAQGRVIGSLLGRLLDDAFIKKLPPKSTGRDHFNPEWLDKQLEATVSAHGPMAPEDVQATLAEFTAQAAAASALAALPNTQRLLVCGGGALNDHLMNRLQARCGACTVTPTSAAGVDPMHVEAAAFAWLAHVYLLRQPGNLPEVTGALGLRLLGALHLA